MLIRFFKVNLVNLIELDFQSMPVGEWKWEEKTVKELVGSFFIHSVSCAARPVIVIWWIFLRKTKPLHQTITPQSIKV